MEKKGQVDDYMKMREGKYIGDMPLQCISCIWSEHCFRDFTEAYSFENLSNPNAKQYHCDDCSPIDENRQTEFEYQQSLKIRAEDYQSILDETEGDA